MCLTILASHNAHRRSAVPAAVNEAGASRIATGEHMIDRGAGVRRDAVDPLEVAVCNRHAADSERLWTRRLQDRERSVHTRDVGRCVDKRRY